MTAREMTLDTGTATHDSLFGDSNLNNFGSSSSTDNSADANLSFGNNFGANKMAAAHHAPVNASPDAPIPMFAVMSSSGSSASQSSPTSSATTTSTIITVGTTPNWCLSLSNANIANTVKTDVAGGTITYTEMLSLLNSVASSGPVTASEFSDLKTIAANLNNGVTTSSYCASIFTKLVCGDPANAHWNGGSNTAVALGNLAAGTSTAQMSELIGKWFLGTDLPGTGFTSIPTSYVQDTGPLYGSSGAPNVADINQGSLGDCYLEASMAEVALMDPGIIESMIQSNGNGSYGVRFYINGVATWVTVNNFLPVSSQVQYFNSGLLFNNSPDLWASLIEKAYVELNASGVLPHTAGNSYNLIAGGWADPITEITNKSLNYYSVSSSASAQNTLKQTMITALSQDQEVWLASYANTTVNGKTAFVSSHAYSVIGYDSKTGDFIVRNPWGTVSWQYWNTTFEASMADLYADGAYLAIANGGTISGKITGISETPASATLSAGKAVTITLTTNAAVTITGTPTLTLNDGGTATYVSGSGTSSLTFSYTVLAGQNTPALAVTAINLPNGATMSAYGAACNLSIAGLTQTGPQIDTLAPGAPKITGDAVTYNFVTLNGTAEANSTVTVFDGSTRLGTATANGSGVWSYKTGALANGVNAFTATATDAAGNVSAVSSAFNQTISYTPPKVASVLVSGTGITNGKGLIGAGKVITFALTMSASVLVTGTPTLALNDGGTATYISGSGTGVLYFNYVVGAGQNTSALAVIGVNLPNGAAIKDGAGNAVTLSGAAATFAGLQIDTIAPNAPVISGETLTANKAALAGTAEAGSIVTVYDNSVKLGTATAASNGAWTFTTGVLASGAHKFQATAQDAAGNTGALSNPLELGVGNGTVLYSVQGAAAQMIGTGNNDLFYVNNTNDKVIQSAGSGNIIVATVNYTLPTNVDFLLTELNATQGVGNNDAINYLYDYSNVACTLIAGSGTDSLAVGVTSGATLIGGAGHDTFAFLNNLTGKDTITNFNTGKDALQFNKSLFANFTAAMTHANQVGANTVITIDGNDQVTLQNVAKNTLTANNFHFL